MTSEQSHIRGLARFQALTGAALHHVDRTASGLSASPRCLPEQRRVLVGAFAAMSLLITLMAGIEAAGAANPGGGPDVEAGTGAQPHTEITEGVTGARTDDSAGATAHHDLRAQDARQVRENGTR